MNGSVFVENEHNETVRPLLFLLVILLESYLPLMEMKCEIFETPIISLL